MPPAPPVTRWPVVADDQGELFELVLDPRRPTTAEKLSPDQRRTVRQREMVDTGWHPLTRTRARPDLGTCGTCVHRRSLGRTYPKCGLGPITSGPGTDVRAWWPACERFEARG